MIEVFLQNLLFFLNVSDLIAKIIMLFLCFIHLNGGKFLHLFNFLNEHVILVFYLIEFSNDHCVILATVKVFLLSIV